MTINDWLRQAVASLEKAGIETARLDALVLLEDVTDVDRARLLAEPRMELSSGHVTRLKKLLRRRAGHEPLAYIRGKTEFYGREFLVTPAVLVPRPESETMIELLKDVVPREFSVAQHGAKLQLADVGTGSGALGITAKLELRETKNIQVDLLEIDPAAVAVARQNIKKHMINISVLQNDLLNETKRHYDILLCNLPYVPAEYAINQAARHEPRLALCGGVDGLDLYRRVFQQITGKRQKPLLILTEALPEQHVRLRDMAAKADYTLSRSHDFIQVFRHTG